MPLPPCGLTPIKSVLGICKKTFKSKNTSMKKTTQSSLEFQIALESLGTKRVCLGQAIDLMGDKGPQAMLLLLTLPNITVVPSLPFLPLLFGLPAMGVCISMMLASTHIWIPDFVANRSLKKARAVKLAKWAVRLTSYASPRLVGCTRGNGLRASAALAFLLTIILCLPLPGLNIMPGLGVVIIATGLMESDGVLVIIGAGLGIGGCALMGIESSVLLDNFDKVMADIQ